MADGGEQLYWQVRERYEYLSWALTELESNKRFSSSPTRFRGGVMDNLKEEVLAAHEEMLRLGKTRRTDKLCYESSRKPPGTAYQFSDGGVVYGKGYHTAATPHSLPAPVPIASRKHAIKELSDSLAVNMGIVGPRRHDLSPKEKFRNSLVATHIDDCVNLIKSNGPSTTYRSIIKEALPKGKDKYATMGGSREDWSERLALDGAKCKGHYIR